MTSPLENLSGPGKPLRAEPPDALDLGPAMWRILSKCHNIRNLGEYEGDLNVDERIVTDLVAACQVVAAKVDALALLES